MKKIVAAVPLLLAAFAANAFNYQGYVTNVTPYNGRLFISVNNGNFDGAASTCYVASGFMIFSADVSTATTKAVMAAALSAKLTGKQVYVYGDGTCASVGNPYDSRGSENMIGIDLKG